MRIAQFVLARVFIALVTLLGVAILIFFAMRAIPGSFEDVVLGPISEPEARAAIAERFGLDRPLPEQFFRWLMAVTQGDFGVSMVTRRSVSDEILRRAPATIQLAIMCTIVAITIGLPLGVLSGLGESSRFTQGFGRMVGAVGTSVPDFVLGTVFVFVFSVWSLGLTVGGYVPFTEDPVTNLRAMALPTITIGVFGIALILRTTRDSVKRVLTEGHITAAVARGEPPREIIRHHVIRNALIPVLTVTASYIGHLLGGAVVVEVLFSLPGVGLFTYNALSNRDYAIVHAGVLIAATVFITINMLADIAYALLDPRIGARNART